MASTAKPQKPILPTALREGVSLMQAAQDALSADGDVTALRFEGGELADVQGTVLEFSGCTFARCRFLDTGVKRMSFVDCVFEKCELSNAHLPSTTFQRVVFQNCRMTGAELLKAMLINVRFSGCMMDYLACGDAKLDHVLFDDCRLRESAWTNVRMKQTAYQACDLTRAEWQSTPLAGLDMSSDQIDGWRISLFDLRGMRITPAQLVALSGLLGVELVDA